ncbi:MAG: alkaline phosphatase family protein [bacterium]
MNDSNALKIMVVGLDGATWRILDPMMRAGRLPNLQKLVRTGSAGILKSIEPMVSPTIWTSIASGKLPEKHGVWDFVVASHSVRCKRIWDMATERGLRVGLCGYMVTWPPPAVNGFVIPGSFSRGVETHPGSLQAIRELDVMQRSEHRKSWPRLLQLAWHCHRLGVRFGSLAEAAVVLARLKANKNFLSKFFATRKLGAQFYTDVFVQQVRRFHPHLAMYVNMLIDATSHNFWKFMEPEGFADVKPEEIVKYRHVVHAAYESADAALGYILDRAVDDRTVVMVLSDHGFQSVPEAQGRTPDRTVRILPEMVMKILGWDGARTRTFNIRGATYFRDREENVQRLQQMESDLRGICLAGSEAPLFDVSRDLSGNLEIRLRHDVDQIDDLAVRLPNHRVIAANKIIEGDTSGISGDHHPEGVLIVAGPGIRRGYRLENASVLDITPTLLALLDLPVGKDMDGRVLQEIFEEKSRTGSEVRSIETWEDAAWQYENDAEAATEELKDHLRSLGYL